MTLELILSILAASLATFIITARSPMATLMGFLILIFIISGIYWHLNVPFLAVMLLLLTTGTSIVLFLAIMTASNPLEKNSESPQQNSKPIIGLLSLCVFLGVMILVIDQNASYLLIDQINPFDSYELFKMILKDYFIPFSLISLLIFSSTIVILSCTIKGKI